MRVFVVLLLLLGHAQAVEWSQILPHDMAGPTELMKALYGNQPVEYPDCQGSPCAVHVVANQQFDDNGVTNAILVTAAEPVDPFACHACTATIGIAWLIYTPANGWKLKLGKPDVVRAGNFGKAPDVTIFNGGVWGKGIAIEQGDIHQGHVDRLWQMFVPKENTFVPVLRIQTLADSTGDCGTGAQCVMNDFKIDLKLSIIQNGISVVETTSYPSVLGKPSITKTVLVTK